MSKIIGQKEIFAIEIDILKFEPSIWGKSCLWINNIQFGDFDDENILGPFLRSLMRIAMSPESFWSSEFENLDCKQVFYKIYPFYNEPDKLLSLSAEELSKYESFDKSSLFLGENFDSWSIDVLIQNELCKFIWVHYPKRDSDTYEVRNNIQCLSVPIKKVQEAYKELCQLIPDQYWPSMLEKLH